MADIAELHLLGPRWIDRRVDRFEFVGLTTIQRSITLTVNLAEIPRAAGPTLPPDLIPIAFFSRAGPPTRVTDASGAIVRRLSSAKASALLREAIRTRLDQLGIAGADIEANLDDIARHRADSCARLTPVGSPEPEFDGYADLAAEKWGCPAVGSLLARLSALHSVGPVPSRLRDIVHLLFDWQNCEPLVIEVPAGDNAALATLTLSFDEELAQWLLPWDRRSRALAPGGDALLEDRKLAESVSRGGPFHDDLEMLWPAGLRGWLLGRRRPLLRRVGRRERLRQTWHVVWEQWASGAIGSHVEVIVPAELSIVRLRCLHPPDTAGELKCDVARQVGLRAHINLPSEQRQPPELMSLLLAEHDQRSWKAGTTVALLTGLLLTLAVWLLLPRLEAELEATVALILLGPAFTAGLLSLRAASEIADELLTGVRFLLALVALATVACAAVLIVGCDLATRVLVSAFGAMLVGVGWLLFLGAQRAGQLQQESAERETVSDVPIGARLCAREDRVRTPLPDRWIVSGEGERMPWGWLPSGQGSLGAAADPTFDVGACEEDRRYWANVLGTGVGAAAVQHLIDFCRQARG